MEQSEFIYPWSI